MLFAAGEAPDAEEGLRFMRQAARLGFAPAQHCLGMIFCGKAGFARGIAPDPAVGVDWLRKVHVTMCVYTCMYVAGPCGWRGLAAQGICVYAYIHV